MCATMTIRVDNARGRRRQDTGRSDHHRGMGEELPRRARRAKPSQYNERRRMDHRLRRRGDRRREADQRSEEHTSELQLRGHLVCRLLLEKKKPAKEFSKISTLSKISDTIPISEFLRNVHTSRVT